MSERTDHAAEARVMLSGENMYGSPQEAIAHATLALVEQQRIANLIALSQAMHANGSRIAPWAATHPTDEWSAALNDEIKEALDLS